MNIRKAFVSEDNDDLSTREQVELLGINRSTFYYKKKSDLFNPDKKLMIMIDIIFQEHPYYGTRRMTTSLKLKGVQINRKKVRRIMRLMELMPIYPKPNLSKRNSEHKIYPYLLKDLKIIEKNQVWATDITYIPMDKGHAYLAAVIDWQSRKILSWKLSTTLDTDFCIEVLEEALKHNEKPGIFNTDQGSQYTSKAHTGLLKEYGIKISMDSRGRALDNIMIERFWGSLKREKIYINEYSSVQEVRKAIGEYIDFYNNERPHQSLNDYTPAYVYENGISATPPWNSVDSLAA